MDFRFHSDDMLLNYPKQPSESIAHAAERGGKRSGHGRTHRASPSRTRPSAGGMQHGFFGNHATIYCTEGFNDTTSFGFPNYLGTPVRPFPDKFSTRRSAQ